MPKHLFCQSLSSIQYTQENKIIAIILANTYVNGYNFIDQKFQETICQVFKIKSQFLIQLKQIQRFDVRIAKPITYAIYFTLTIDIYTESLIPLFIINLKNYFMIHDLSQMKKHGVIIIMINNFLAF